MHAFRARPAYAPRSLPHWFALAVVAVVVPGIWSALVANEARDVENTVDAATLSALVLETPNPVQEGPSSRRPVVLRTSWFGRLWPPGHSTRASVANRNNNPLNIKFG